MDFITELTKIDIIGFIATGFLLMSVVISIVTIIGKFSEILGKPFKWVKTKNKDHDLLIMTKDGLHELHERHEEFVTQSVLRDKMIKKDLESLADTVNGIAITLNDMQEKDNETEVKRLKDSLVRYYNKYKTLGKWSKLEKDAFWDLFDDYEKRGGDGYIHSIVEPAMRSMKMLE